MTPICLTNHAYWNLSGDFEKETIHDHTLKLPNCSKYFVLDSNLIPTGEHRDVSGTPFDFVEGGKIGDKERLTGAIDGGGQPGVDHPYVINDADLDSTTPTKLNLAAELSFDNISMSIHTTQPELVVYTGNFLP
jgi:aldose 1-epimerase